MSGAEPGEALIFIVEDHQTMQRILSRLIEAIDGVRLCGTAASAEEALEAVPACQPDLLLVDISLPGMDGIEFIRQAAKHWPAIKSLAVSGHDEVLYARTALRAGARGYVMKGESAQLADAIRSVLDGQLYVSDQVRDARLPR